MKLTKFTVRNFRSITTARKIPISQSTVILGKNNEGKSNILQALVMAMRALQTHGRAPVPTYLGNPAGSKPNAGRYDWERDFPVQYQSRSSRRQTTLGLDFSLTRDEIAEFEQELSLKSDGCLPVEVSFNRQSRPQITLKKPGKCSKTYNAKSKNIGKFITDRLSFNYIPAVRTEREALWMIQEMVSDELQTLEQDPKYQAALDTITNLQAPLLADLGQKLTKSLGLFLPNIRAVDIQVSEVARRQALRRDIDV